MDIRHCGRLISASAEHVKCQLLAIGLPQKNVLCPGNRWHRRSAGQEGYFFYWSWKGSPVVALLETTSLAHCQLSLNCGGSMEEYGTVNGGQTVLLLELHESGCSEGIVTPVIQALDEDILVVQPLALKVISAIFGEEFESSDLMNHLQQLYNYEQAGADTPLYLGQDTLAPAVNMIVTPYDPGTLHLELARYIAQSDMTGSDREVLKRHLHGLL
jgi:hypothetical protein